MFLGTVDQHYNRLYNAKHFRNRVLRIQKLCSEFKYDAVLLVVGIDTYHDKEMKKFKNWLFYGLSGYEIEGTSLNEDFNDSFCVISKDSFQAYTTTSGYKELSRLSALIPNRNIYCLTKEQEKEENQELSEVKKIAKFYEMVCDKSVIGLPAREVKPEDTFTTEIQMIEKWPICQSYGLDIVGEGFFTMKHQVKNIREALNIIYREYDSFAVYAVIYDEIPKTGHHIYDNFYSFLKGNPQKRMDTSEKDLTEALTFRYEIGQIGQEESKREDGLSAPRTLFGINTNLDYTSLSSVEKLWKFGQEDDKVPVHMTIEYVERRTCLRFARTYMLSNCAVDYMKGYELDVDPEAGEINKSAEFCEQSATLLLNSYIALIKAFFIIKDMYFHSKIDKHDYLKVSYACFLKMCEKELNLEIDELRRVFTMDNFSIDIMRYNCMGELLSTSNPSYLTLYMIRMQVKNITVNNGEDNLGSIVYADSFFETSGHSLNITKNVSSLQLYYTTFMHYKNLTQHWFAEKQIKCQRFGERQFILSNLHGVYPIKSRFSEVVPDFILIGKVIVYEKCLIFEDSKMHNFIIDYNDIEQVDFYVSKHTWGDFKLKDNTCLPANKICDSRILINFEGNFYSKNMNLLCEYIGEEKITKKAENIEQVIDYFKTNQYKNFKIQTLVQNKDIYTGYLDFGLFENEYKMFMEYTLISSFNQIRNKAFVSYSQFAQIWDTAQSAYKSLKEASDKIKLVLVSGIPGSGKSSFGIYLSKLFAKESIQSSTFIMPVAESTKFTSDAFLNGLFKHCEQNPTQTVVAVIPSYHHLKKAIFEFKKDTKFNDLFNLEYVITKVSAKNFYKHENRNTYQFMLENCLKGICDAVIFEKGNQSQEDFVQMRKELCEVNDDANILNVRGRTFEWKDLEEILQKKDSKYSLLYGKYFYGFEKEGKSAYYLENSSSGYYFPYRIPLRTDLLEKGIHRVFNNPIQDPSVLIPEEEKRCDFHSTVDSISTEDTDNKENILVGEETGSEKIERRRKKKMEDEQKRIQADLAQERMLIDEITLIKNSMKKNAFIIERVKGLFLVENKELESDYKIISNYTDVSVKSCNNETKRVLADELGFLVYGKNIAFEKFKDVLGTFRTQLRSKLPLRSSQSITEQEKKMLEEKYFCEHMPSNFYHDGYSYVDEDGNRQSGHPNIEKLIEIFIEDENAKIAEYNRQVQKEWKQDEIRYA